MGSSRLARIITEARRRRLPGVLFLYVVAAWVVLQAADLFFPGWKIPEEAIRFVWIGAVALVPVVIVFGWLYDLSSAGITRTPAHDGEPTRLRGLDFGILTSLGASSLLVIFAAGQQVLSLRDLSPTVQSASIEAPLNSVAVLPFVNMSESDDTEYFSDGITEQLLNELARIPGLHVAARTSSFYFKGKNESMRTMGEQLGVRTLVEGSVRRAGSRVRITAQLINAENGFHLWSDTYDRDLDDIFAVQDEIALAIANAMQIELFAQERQRLDRIPTDNMEVYDLYLRAQNLRQTYSAEAIAESNTLLEEAIRLEPRFALGLDALGFGYILETFYNTRSVDDAVELAMPLLESAIEIQPDLEEAYASLGLLNNRLRRFDEANANFETALRINPQYFGALVNHGLNLIHQGQLSAASAHYFRAQSLDPLNSNLSYNLGSLLMLLGEYDQGHRFIEKSFRVEPSYVLARAALTHWSTRYGRLVEAVMNGRALAEEMPEYALNLTALATAYVYLGMLDEAQETVDLARDSATLESSVTPTQELIWWASGDSEAYIEKAIADFGDVDVGMGSPLGSTDRSLVHRYGLALLYRGDYEDAARHLDWAAGGVEGIATTTYDDMFRLKPLAHAYMALGRDEESAALVEQCLELAAGARNNGWATPQLHARVAELHAIAGDVENALSELEVAVDKGFREIGKLEFEIYWQALQSNEAFNAIKVRIIEDIERQRERLQIALST